jgi:hypothetical protein
MVDATASGHSSLINLATDGVVAGSIPYCILLGAIEWSEWKALAPSSREANSLKDSDLNLTGSTISVQIMNGDSPLVSSISSRKFYSSVVYASDHRQSIRPDQ